MGTQESTTQGRPGKPSPSNSQHLGLKLAKMQDEAEEAGTRGFAEAARQVAAELRAKGIDPKTRLPIKP